MILCSYGAARVFVYAASLGFKDMRLQLARLVSAFVDNSLVPFFHADGNGVAMDTLVRHTQLLRLIVRGDVSV